MAKDLSISYLLDFYGQMLTDKQREVTEFYYNDDLSLAEIADHCHITRQGVRDSIKRAEAQLREYEEKLGLVARYVAINRQARACMAALDALGAGDGGAMTAARQALENILQIER